MINTLTHSAHTICSTPQLLESELQHLEDVLGQCKYPKWANKKILQQQQQQQQQQEKKRRNNKKLIPTSKHPVRKCHIVVPYVQGICESIKNICGKHGVAVHFKGGQTFKIILVSPKDKDSMANKNSVIYSYSCGEIDCDEEYIGESGMTFGERLREHL